MIILLVVIGIALGCGLMGAIAGIMIDRWRRESRQLDTDIAEYEKRGRHAKTQPRRQPERTSLVQAPRAVLPIPGPGRPQARRTSEPGTAIIPKHGSIGTALDQVGVSPRLGLPATSGEMRAITDDFEATMAIEEDAFRADMKARLWEGLTA